MNPTCPYVLTAKIYFKLKCQYSRLDLVSHANLKNYTVYPQEMR